MIPTRVTTTTIPLAWSATDTQAGVAAYDLDVSTDGGVNGWQRLLTGTTATSHTYQLPLSTTRCTFRLTATDHVGNAASVEITTYLVSVIKYYYHGGRRIAMRQTSVGGEAVLYLHADHLGSTSLTTDADGNVAARQLYHPYGTVRYGEGTLTTDFGFTGQRAIAGTGLMHYGARYYHPALGRFVSADTMVPKAGNPQDFNRYAYTRNNSLI